MKVAVLGSLLKAITPVTTGGTEAFAYTLAEGLVQAGVDTTLFATSDSITTAKLESVCSSKETFDVSEGPVALNTAYELLQARNAVSRSGDFDVIHNNYWYFYSLTSFSQFTSTPILTTVHNNFWHLPNLKRMLIETHVKGKDLVVFASKAAQRLAEGKVDSEVVYHGIDEIAFPYSQEADDYVLWFSRLVPVKGIKEAMNAASVGGFSLVVAGAPPSKQKNKLFIANEVEPYFSDKIKYVGTPTETDRLSLYQHAKAFLFPTLGEEQFGLVLTEAMSCGTPVIAYNRGAVSEVVSDGVTGFVIDPDDEPRPGKGTWIIKKQGIEGLVEAVKRIGEIDRRQCRTHVENNFTRDRMISQYITLYERMR